MDETRVICNSRYGLECRQLSVLLLQNYKTELGGLFCKDWKNILHQFLVGTVWSKMQTFSDFHVFYNDKINVSTMFVNFSKITTIILFYTLNVSQANWIQTYKCKLCEAKTSNHRHQKSPFHEVFRYCETKFSPKRSLKSPLIPNVFRNQKIWETLKGSRTKRFDTDRQTFLMKTRNSPVSESFR